jgi:hypothetical protein
MDNKDQKMKIVATYKDEEIDLSQVAVTMTYDGQEATIDCETALKRSLHLVYENAILRNAVTEAKAIFEAQQQQKSKIILPGDE